MEIQYVDKTKELIKILFDDGDYYYLHIGPDKQIDIKKVFNDLSNSIKILPYATNHIVVY